MQNFRLHRKLYHTSKIDETEYSKKAYERYEKILLFSKLKSEGCSEKTALEAIALSRSAYYRLKKRYNQIGLAGLEDQSKRPNKVRVTQWGAKEEQLVTGIRKKYPLWGKYKLSVMINREHGVYLSPSTVGRILKKLFTRGTIKQVNLLLGKREVRPRVFTGHAQRWRLGMKSGSPGELIQVDHMHIQLPNGKSIKHFKAVCPMTKLTVEQAYMRACSSTASSFLRHMQACFPFKIQSIQVDGGSEFMGVFEKACKVEAIGLYVLPPRSPEYNGTVERGNKTVKYEFYHWYNASENLLEIQREVQKYAKFYNTVRPHQALNYLTPMEFFSQLEVRP